MIVKMINGNEKVEIKGIGTIYKDIPFEVTDEVGKTLISKINSFVEIVPIKETKIKKEINLIGKEE